MFAALALGAVFAPCAAPQADACRGAASALNRVKEQLSPNLPAERLGVMRSTLQTSSNLCKDLPELWVYQIAIEKRLGLDKTRPGIKDIAYQQRKLDESQFQPRYDPFSIPPAAAPVAPDLRIAKVRKK